jgi:hypothetical protein
MGSARSNSATEFLQQYQAGAASGCLGHARLDHGQVGLGIAVVALLDQGDRQGGLVHRRAVPFTESAL